MNLVSVLGIVVLWMILLSRMCMSIVSKALLRSSAARTVLCGGRFLLKPVVIVWFMQCSADVVECRLL